MCDIKVWLEKLSLLLKIGIWCEIEEGSGEFIGIGYQNPLKESVELRHLLRKRTAGQEVPVLYEDCFQVIWGGIKKQGKFFYMGPFAMRNLERMEWHHYCMEYQLNSKMGKYPEVFSLTDIMAFMELMGNIILEKKLSGRELLRQNHIIHDTEMSLIGEKKSFLIQYDNLEIQHHTYYEEWKLLEYVRSGNVRDAMRMNLIMDDRLGRLGKDDVGHWRNVVVVVVTLCTRAAIEGGLNPANAYFLSDFYIRKSANCHTVLQLMECRNSAVIDLTEQVRTKFSDKNRTDYVEMCKDYINKHYREKLYLDKIAEALGLTGQYLSRIFSRETGTTLQEYICHFRVKRAANLLKYSDEEIAVIADYVNFPTQSYFGRVFKKYMGMTPREYRKKYKTIEFSSEKHTSD